MKVTRFLWLAWLLGLSACESGSDTPKRDASSVEHPTDAATNSGRADAAAPAKDAGARMDAQVADAAVADAAGADAAGSDAGGGSAVDCGSDVVLSTMSDVAAVIGCSEIKGSLSISSAAYLTELELPKLERVEQGVTLSQSRLQRITLPVLKSVGVVFSISNNRLLTQLDLPALSDVDGAFDLSLDQVLPAVSLPALTHVGGGVELWQNTELAKVEFPKLKSVDTNFELVASDVITSLELPALETVGVTFNVSFDKALAQLKVPKLTMVGTVFQVVSNPMLPSCQADNLHKQLSGFNGTKQIADNLATCP